MALDNILALFMLPLFGAISDKCRHRLGRRTPFILVGTIVAAVAFVGLTFADNMQLKQIEKVSKIDDPAALTEIYNQEKDSELQTPDGDKFTLSTAFSEAEFVEIRSQITSEEGKTITNPNYTNQGYTQQGYANQGYANPAYTGQDGSAQTPNNNEDQ